MPRFGVQRLADAFEMFPQQLGRGIALVDRRIQQGVPGEHEALGFALEADCFGGAAPQVNGQHLVPNLGCSVQKWQRHNIILLQFPNLASSDSNLRARMENRNESSKFQVPSSKFQVPGSTPQTGIALNFEL